MSATLHALGPYHGLGIARRPQEPHGGFTQPKHVPGQARVTLDTPMPPAQRPREEGEITITICGTLDSVRAQLRALASSLGGER